MEREVEADSEHGSQVTDLLKGRGFKISVSYSCTNLHVNTPTESQKSFSWKETVALTGEKHVMRPALEESHESWPMARSRLCGLATAASGGNTPLLGCCW